MNFFEQELRRLFGDGSVIQFPWFSGNACLGMIDGSLRVRAEFVDTRVHGEYESLKLTVLNCTDGPVDSVKLTMADIWNTKGDNPQKKTPKPRIRYDYYGDKMVWVDYRPSAADYQALQRVAGDYLDVFRERSQEREPPPPARKSPGRSSLRKARDER